MHLFALSQDASDFYTVCGFVVGVVSFLVGVVAFIIALVQLRDARDAARASKSAADAAREAAEKVLTENRDAYERFVADYAGRLLVELQGAVNGPDWKVAALRARDLADLFATLPPTGIASADAIIREAVTDLREFDHTFTEFESKRTTKMPLKVMSTQWKPLLKVLKLKLDQLRAPFRRKEQHGQGDSGSPARQDAGDHQSSADQNQSGASELGPERNE